jgi:hypothetical protein
MQLSSSYYTCDEQEGRSAKGYDQNLSPCSSLAWVPKDDKAGQWEELISL